MYNDRTYFVVDNYNTMLIWAINGCPNLLILAIIIDDELDHQPEWAEAQKTPQSVSLGWKCFLLGQGMSPNWITSKDNFNICLEHQVVEQNGQMKT